MADSGSQRLPIIVRFGEGGPPVRTVTRAVGERRVEIVLGADTALPAEGTVVRFVALLAGRPLEGQGRSTRVTPLGADEAVLTVEVTAYAPEARETVRRLAFRQRLVGWVEAGGEAGDGLTARLRDKPGGGPDTRPTSEDRLPPVVVPPGEPVTPPGPAAPRGPVGPRPRARRHHWELDSRFGR